MNSKMLCISHWMLCWICLITKCSKAYGGMFTPNKSLNSMSFKCSVIIMPLIMNALDVRLRGGRIQSLYKINVTLDVISVGWRVCRALSLPTCWRLLHYQRSISQLLLPLRIFSQEDNRFGSQIFSKYLLTAKDDDTDPCHPVSPTAASFLWGPKRAVAGNKSLNHLPSLKRHQGVFAGQ